MTDMAREIVSMAAEMQLEEARKNRCSIELMLRRRFKFTIDLLIHSNSSLTLVYGGMHFQVPRADKQAMQEVLEMLLDCSIMPQLNRLVRDYEDSYDWRSPEHFNADVDQDPADSEDQQHGGLLSPLSPDSSGWNMVAFEINGKPQLSVRFKDVADTLQELMRVAGPMRFLTRVDPAQALGSSSCGVTRLSPSRS